MSGNTGWKPKANPWLIALVVTLAAFMEVLDTTIINVALPHIAGSMSASNDESTWTLTSYLVANGIVLPISGWLGRVIGRKRYFLICIGMFTVCSLLCGLATELWQLILFRLAQGFFGGGLQPNQQAIILDTFPPNQRGTAFSITAIATVIAPVVGPTLGGLITDHANWRWIFFINIPVGVFTFFAVTALVEDPPWAGKGDKSIDAIGLGLIALGLGCLQIVMDRGEDEDWFGSGFIRVFSALSAIGIIGAIAWLSTAKKPVVTMKVFLDRNFAVGCVLISATFGILYASAVLIPQMAQQVLGYTATLSGYILSPGALLLLGVIPIIGKLMPLIQTRMLICTGFLLLGLAMFYSQSITPDVDFWTLTKMRIAQTAGLAFLFVPIQTVSFATLPKELNGDAAALSTMLRNVFGSIGISLSTALVTTRTQVRSAHLIDHLGPFDKGYVDSVQAHAQTLIGMGYDPAHAQTTAVGMIYQTLRTQSQVLAYADVFLFCGVLAFVIAPTALLLTGIKAGGGAAAAH